MVNAAFSGNTRESYRFESCPDYFPYFHHMYNRT